ERSHGFFASVFRYAIRLSISSGLSAYLNPGMRCVPFRMKVRAVFSMPGSASLNMPSRPINTGGKSETAEVFEYCGTWQSEQRWKKRYSPAFSLEVKLGFGVKGAPLLVCANAGTCAMESATATGSKNRKNNFFHPLFASKFVVSALYAT